ncbi:MAG TPA: UDP-N-acetylmuramoyl-L-alanyl-D-glutamate--2,6-diaminopimelate ligase [Trueperaceae bacterium]|nr:UDP-N-acetylmuramoyl-L-alanyl-D-glutamate--2,6-diaminopimelate ligase [Trueperaceae bacterium]
MTLRELVKKALNQDVRSDAEVTGVAQDSRKVLPAYIFVARSGEFSDGHDFAKKVADIGAVAIVGERNIKTLLGLPYISVANAKLATAKLAAAFYSYPCKNMFCFGITGTDGKTTSSYLLHHLLSAKYKTGLLSTAATKIGYDELKMEGHFTTPESPEVQQILAIFRDEAISHAVIETSSHGFAQYRLDEISFNIGVWTNLSPEHLDFHGNIEEYRKAKINLVKRSKLSILNRDDASYPYFEAEANSFLSYGENINSDYRILKIETNNAGQKFELEYAGNNYRCELNMIGRYNVFNAVAALAAANQAGLSLDDLIERLKEFRDVPGRMQLVQAEPFRLIVDFAHTPVALQKALQAIKPTTKNRIIVLIGAAGERDKTKRAALAKISVRFADIAIFTEEDSRSENIVEILIEMARGAIAAGGKATKDYWTIPNREAAIELAINMAKAGDTILLAGKGHEDMLERKHESIPWNEVQIAKKYLLKKK